MTNESRRVNRKRHSNYLLRSAFVAGLGAMTWLPTAALAGGTTAGGFTSGLPIYALFPEGLYFINQTASGFRTVDDVDIRTNTDILFFYYQSPLKFLGGDVSFVVAPTVFDIITSVSPDEIGFYNTYFASQVSWAITDALRIGYRIGGYIPQDGPVAYNYGTIEQRAGLTYLANGLQMTANFMYGVTVGNGQQDRGPDYFVADLSATQTFGKWQLGPVMYATADLTSPYAGYQKQSQVAVGGLVGYDFGGATLQLKLTTDVSESNYGGRETVVWSNLIIPLWTAKPAPAAPAVHK